MSDCSTADVSFFLLYSSILIYIYIYPLPFQEIQSPIGLRWRIPRKRLRYLSKLYDDGAFDLESKQFYATSIPGVRYSLVMHRNDYKSDEPEKIWISLYLSLKYKMKIDAKYSISIDTPKFLIETKHGYKKTKNSTYWEADGRAFECPPLEDLIDGAGILTIKLDGVLTIQNSLNLSIERLKVGSLVRMLYKRQDKDFTFIVGGQEIQVSLDIYIYILDVISPSFQAHKLVLATRSPVLSELFKRDAKEVRDGQMELHNFDFATVEAAVLYFYDLPSYLPVSTTMSLLLFAEKFGIVDLKVCRWIYANITNL